MDQVKEFVVTFIKAIILIALIIGFVYIFFMIADFVGIKFGIDLYAPASLIGSIIILILAGVVLYHRITSLLE